MLSETVSPLRFRDVPIDWDALEDAFENNAPDVHSFLNIVTGDVLRLLDSRTDPATFTKTASDPNCLRIQAVSSRQQYDWMALFTDALPRGELRMQLAEAIAGGKGAFRRFKNAVAVSAERERWFAFRSEKLRNIAEAWLANMRINPVPRTTKKMSASECAASLLLEMSAADFAATLTAVAEKRCLNCGAPKPCARHVRKARSANGTKPATVDS